MFKKLNLYHLATILVIVFDIGHTVGGVLFHKSSGVREDLVLSTMENVHLQIGGADSTYAGFQRGYGLLTSIFLLLSAFLTWQMAKRPEEPVYKPILWMLFVCFIGVAWISWKYFFPGPGSIATVVAFILGYKSFQGFQKWKAAEKRD